MFEISTWIEIIGWSSTIAFLFSIVVPQRTHLHQIGIFTSITTGIYSYAHGATAIWVKWSIAFFFHGYMLFKLRETSQSSAQAHAQVDPSSPVSK